jgi:hypothetical protein
MDELVTVVVPRAALLDFRTTVLNRIDRVTRRNWLSEMKRVLLATRGQPANARPEPTIGAGCYSFVLFGRLRCVFSVETGHRRSWRWLFRRRPCRTVTVWQFRLHPPPTRP